MVSSAAEINNPSWAPGDTIVMTNGTWMDQSISLIANGTAEEPVVLIAETPGEVILTGSSRLAFSGEYIVISGLYFKDGNAGTSAVISFRTSSSILANHCTVTNTTIINYNPTSSTTDSKWVSIYGAENRVDHCTFINKTNSGTLLVVWLKSGITPNHVIEYNYFGYRNSNLDASGNEINGQEIIRIGDSSTSMQTAGVRVSNNFFEHCNGEIEIISNKSCENIFTNNVFYECVGMLTLRHGNRCTVEGNYFFGNGISNTGGVRIIGEDHTVYNNYFENLNGSGFRAALCIVRGKENSALNEYFQVKNALVIFNTMVNCKQSFSINYNTRSDCTMPPTGTSIAHNHVYNPAVPNNNISLYYANDPGLDVTWKNNLMNQGGFSGITVDTTQVIKGIDPSMIPAGTYIGLLEPAESSALGNYTSDEYPLVEIDIRGRNRGTAKVPGASQLSGTVALEMPTRENTGSDYYTPPVAMKKYRTREITVLDAYALNGEIHINITEPGTLSVYDLSGKCLYLGRVDIGNHATFLPTGGIYILRFNGASGNIAVKKIAFN